MPKKQIYLLCIWMYIDKCGSINAQKHTKVGIMAYVYNMHTCVCVWVSPHLRRLVSSVITLYINIIAASQVLKTRELRFKDDQR